MRRPHPALNYGIINGVKVWIENPFDNLPAEGHRPQRYWLMAAAFARAGHEVTLWTSDFSHATKSPRVLRETVKAPFELRLVHTPPYTKNISLARIRSHRAYAGNWLRTASAEAAAHGGPDLLIVSLPPLATADAALALKAAFGARLVVDVMDAWPETFERLLPRGLRALGRLALFPLRRAAARAYRGADLVTGVCDAYEEIARGAGAKDYRRFYHGIALPADAAPRARAPGRRALVYAGSLGRGYDLSAAIRAVLERDDLTLDIAGAGEREAEWRALAGDEPRIRFHGYLGEEALGRLLDASDIGVIPLADDTFVGLPYKLGDYAAHALKMVTSLGGECAAFLARHRAGAVYRAGDAASFLAALEKAAEAEADFPAMLAELDAARIYDAYAACATQG